ncbi:hypothetical protein Tco_1286693, partial [Tanacetum coccineum]
CLQLHALHAKPWENEFKSFSGQCRSEDIRQLKICPHEPTSPEDDASELGFEAKMLTKGLLSAGANGLTLRVS